MRLLKNMSLRSKQTLIIMLTSSVALLLACAMFVTYDTVAFRRESIDNVSVLAEAIGNNCAAAIDFNDPKTAKETLAALRAQDNIVSACVYSRDGQMFAAYQRDVAASFVPPAASRIASAEFTSDQLRLFRLIKHRGELIGTIFVASDLKGGSARLMRYIGIVGLVFLASLVLAYLLSSRLQRLISGPILHLVQTAHTVASEKNYSVRAVKQSNDELGQLVDGFNEMLAQIQARDGALQIARDNLEMRVGERTQDLAKANVALRTENAERQRAEATARESEAKFHQLADNITDVFWITSPDLRVMLYISAGYELIWGRSMESLYANPHQWLDVILPEDRERVIAIFGGLMADVPRVSAEYQIERPDGTTRWVLDRGFQVRDATGNLVRLTGIVSDITERKRAEQELRRTEALYRRAIGGAGAVPYSNDFKTRSYLFMGEGIEQLIGYPPQEVTGALWGRIVQKSVMLGAAAGLDKAEAARRVISGELREWRCDMCVTTRDGQTRWISDASVQERDESGRPILSMGILQDITERKQADAELELTHKKLLETSRAAGMAEIATNVLHNVGNVLNSVNISAGLIIESVKQSRASSLARVVGLLEEHAPDLGEFITTDSKGKHVPAHLAQLSAHLLADQAATLKELDLLRANIEHIKEIVAMQQNFAKFSGVKETINVGELVEDSLRMNLDSLSWHGVQVTREFQDVPPMGMEKHKVLQILVNLVRNAKHACNDSGRADKRLTLRVANGEGRVRISVVDNGVGIPPENLTRIFSHGFTTRKGGHGFGLHSGALAAKEMGGSLTVHSDGPDQGATFTLELPLPNAGARA